MVGNVDVINSSAVFLSSFAAGSERRYRRDIPTQCPRRHNDDDENDDDENDDGNDNQDDMVEKHDD